MQYKFRFCCSLVMLYVCTMNAQIHIDSYFLNCGLTQNIRQIVPAARKYHYEAKQYPYETVIRNIQWESMSFDDVWYTAFNDSIYEISMNQYVYAPEKIARHCYLEKQHIFNRLYGPGTEYVEKDQREIWKGNLDYTYWYDSEKDRTLWVSLYFRKDNKGTYYYRVNARFLDMRLYHKNKALLEETEKDK